MLIKASKWSLVEFKDQQNICVTNYPISTHKAGNLRRVN